MKYITKKSSFYTIISCLLICGQLAAWPTLADLKKRFSYQAPEPEKFMQVSNREVELCRRIFGLQAECQLKRPQAYTALGSLLGATLSIARNSNNLRIWQYAPRFCGFVFAGALLGKVVRSFFQSRKTDHVLATRTEHYFPEEYTRQLREDVSAEGHTYLTASGQAQMSVGDREIRKWHNLTSEIRYDLISKIFCGTGPSYGQLCWYNNCGDDFSDGPLVLLPYYDPSGMPKVSYPKNEPYVANKQQQRRLILGRLQHAIRSGRATYGSKEWDSTLTTSPS